MFQLQKTLDYPSEFLRKHLDSALNHSGALWLAFDKQCIQLLLCKFVAGNIPE